MPRHPAPGLPPAPCSHTAPPHRTKPAPAAHTGPARSHASPGHGAPGPRSWQRGCRPPRTGITRVPALPSVIGNKARAWRDTRIAGKAAFPCANPRDPSERRCAGRSVPPEPAPAGEPRCSASMDLVQGSPRDHADPGPGADPASPLPRRRARRNCAAGLKTFAAAMRDMRRPPPPSCQGRRGPEWPGARRTPGPGSRGVVARIMESARRGIPSEPPCRMEVPTARDRVIRRQGRWDRVLAGNDALAWTGRGGSAAGRCLTCRSGARGTDVAGAIDGSRTLPGTRNGWTSLCRGEADVLRIPWCSGGDASAAREHVGVYPPPAGRRNRSGGADPSRPEAG